MTKTKRKKKERKVTFTIIGGVAPARKNASPWLALVRKMRVGEGVRVKNTREACALHVTLLRNGFKSTRVSRGDGSFHVFKVGKRKEGKYNYYKANKK